MSMWMAPVEASFDVLSTVRDTTIRFKGHTYIPLLLLYLILHYLTVRIQGVRDLQRRTTACANSMRPTTRAAVPTTSRSSSHAPATMSATLKLPTLDYVPSFNTQRSPSFSKISARSASANGITSSLPRHSLQSKASYGVRVQGSSMSLRI